MKMNYCKCLPFNLRVYESRKWVNFNFNSWRFISWNILSTSTGDIKFDSRNNVRNTPPGVRRRIPFYESIK